MTTNLAAPTRSPIRRVRVGLEYDRPVPPNWAARLREVSPPSKEHGYLHLVWEPGDQWRPVERWMLYEVVDPTSPAMADAVDPGLLAELQGPHPRTYGHICTEVPTHEWRGSAPKHYQPCLCRHKTESWRRGPCLSVTLTQWRLYQKTGLVGFPFWTIQGNKGGHKFTFTRQESLLLEKEGFPPEPPPPGFMCYAPYDDRVARKIQRFNRLMRYRNSLRMYRQAMSGAGYAKVLADEDRALRLELVEHLKDQMQEANEFFIRGVKKGEHLNLPTSNVNYDRLAEESEAHYVETGQILHESAVA